jgi:hypothetical protein
VGYKAEATSGLNVKNVKYKIKFITVAFLPLVNNFYNELNLKRPKKLTPTRGELNSVIFIHHLDLSLTRKDV